MSAQTKRSYVQQAFEQGCICVFPTEVAARSYLVDYALNGNHHAILSERAISFDTFRSYFLLHQQSRKPANTLIRQLFIRSLLESKVPLQHFLNPAYPEANNRISTALAALLPSLQDALKAEVFALLDDSMKQDLLVLYQQYSLFLDAHDLFEPRFETPMQPASWDTTKQYVILFSDTIKDAEQLYMQLGCPSYITLRPTPDPENPAMLEVFPNHIQEVKTMLRRVRALLAGGVPAHQIVLGCGSPESLLPLIEQEAEFYDVNVAIREGKRATSYPSGRFFLRLKDVYDQRFSLESLKSLLLDPAFPYRDRELHHRFIRRAIDRSILQGSLETQDQFTRMLWDPSLVTWYRNLKQLLIELSNSSTIEVLRRKLNQFQDSYFTAEQWVGTSGEAVYSFCLEALEQVEQAMKMCKITAHPQLFSFFLSYLDTKQYVPQLAQQGVSVYGWPQVATVLSEHCFLVGLDQEAAGCTFNPLSFLPQPLLDQVQTQEDTTIAMLKAALGSDDHLVLSCHVKRYEKEVLPPSYFLERDALVEYQESPNRLDDPYVSELNLYKNGSIPSVLPTLVQSTGFAHAKKTVLCPTQDDSTRHPLPTRYSGIQFSNSLLHVSPTSLDAFSICPFRYLAAYGWSLVQQDWTVQRVDHRTIGTLLHSVYEKFFREIGIFNPHELDAYRSRLTAIFDEQLQRYYGEQGPTPSVRNWLVARYRTQVCAILDEEAKHFGHARSVGFEQELTVQQDSLLLEGRIDRMLILDPPGEKRYAVVDYKKNSVPFKRVKDRVVSYQLPLYRLLVGSVLGAQTAQAAYYSITEGKYYVLWDHEDASEALLCDQQLSVMLRLLWEAVEQGHFMATPSKEHCPSCPFRSLCRRRYATV